MTDSVSLPLDDDAAEVVDHDDFRQIMFDSVASFRGVKALRTMLLCESPDLMDWTERAGVALLLESVQNRLELVVDGLVDTAVKLGMPDALELSLSPI